MRFRHHQSSLTGVGAAIVAVAVACATGGTGAGLVGATTTSTAAMANAAFTTVVTQASTALFDNGGNLGAALARWAPRPAWCSTLQHGCQLGGLRPSISTTTPCSTPTITRAMK